MTCAIVIVQNIPIDYSDFRHSIHLSANCRCKRYCNNEDKVALEQLLSGYGPSKCVYLYSNAIAETTISYVRDNFAHITFQNPTDAARAREAANNHEIQIRNRILSLTVVSDIGAGIEGLDDNCLIEIFSKLDPRDKMPVERVCRRWEKLALNSWSTTKVLNLFDTYYTEDKIKQFLMRCGAYLDEIHCTVVSIQSFRSLLYEYCKNLKKVTLEFEKFSDDDLRQMTRMLAEFKNLVSLSLKGMCRSPLFNFLRNLPRSMEAIRLEVQGSYNPPYKTYFIDLTKFHNLRNLTLSLTGTLVPGDFAGIHSMRNLVHLDIRGRFGLRGEIGELENLQNLKTLKISRCFTDDNTLINILMKNRELECLDVSFVVALTDHSIVYASALPRLKSLNVEKCRQVTLHLIDEMPLLEELYCDDCQRVTNVPLIRVLRSAPKLRVLSIVNCSTHPELCNAADTAVKRRDSAIALKITTSMNLDNINRESLSPLLKLVRIPYYPR